MSVLLEFDSLHNTRDLGGAKDVRGRIIKRGKLIRSGHLAEMTEEDRRRLSMLVGTVVDFRTAAEVHERPDVVLDGVEYHHIPIMRSLVSGITQDTKDDENTFERLMRNPTEARRYMCELYRSFALDDYSVSHYAEFAHYLLKNRYKAVLFHCTGGKDRAGIAAVIVEFLLGVPKDDIIADYLLTNEYQAPTLRQVMDNAKRNTGIDDEVADEALSWLFCAHREYIDAFFEAINERYGSFTTFVWDGLKLTDGDIGWLRDEYLVYEEELS